MGVPFQVFQKVMGKCIFTKAKLAKKWLPVKKHIFWVEVHQNEIQIDKDHSRP